jgi:hypothetical protein
MGQLVRFEAADGSFMWVEATAPNGGTDVDVVVDDSGVGRAVTRLEDSLGSVKGAAVALLSVVDDLRRRNDGVALNTVSLDLALSLGIEGGVVVAKGSAKAEASVTLTWKATAEPGRSSG